MKRFAVVRNGVVEKIILEDEEKIKAMSFLDFKFLETDILEIVDLDENKQSVEINYKYDHNLKKFAA